MWKQEREASRARLCVYLAFSRDDRRVLALRNLQGFKRAIIELGVL